MKISIKTNLISKVKSLLESKTVQVSIQGIVSIFILIGLLACHPQHEEDVAKTEEETTTTSQLKALTEMKYTSHASMDLAVDINRQGGGPAYLSVYSQYEFNDNEHWVIDYDSRLLASYMIDPQTLQEIAIPQHLTHLLIQVWFYDDRAPVSKEIRINKEVAVKL